MSVFRFVVYWFLSNKQLAQNVSSHIKKEKREEESILSILRRNSFHLILFAHLTNIEEYMFSFVCRRDTVL